MNENQMRKADEIGNRMAEELVNFCQMNGIKPGDALVILVKISIVICMHAEDSEGYFHQFIQDLSEVEERKLIQKALSYEK